MSIVTTDKNYNAGKWGIFEKGNDTSPAISHNIPNYVSFIEKLEKQLKARGKKK